MPRHNIDQDDPQLTSYALGEMSQQEAEEFEMRLKDSPLAAKELSAMKELSAVLRESLEEEWKQNATGSTFEEEFAGLSTTSYAAGEMTAEEKVQFESELNQSAELKDELASMEDFMSMLTDSFEKEWRENALEPAASAEVSENVVGFGQGSTSQRKSQSRGRGLAIAAACAAMLAVGAVFVDRTEEAEATGGWANADSAEIVNSVDSTHSSQEEAQIRVPTLFLAEELRGMEADIPSVNAGYLEEGRILKASFQPQSSSQPTSSSSTGGIDPLWFKEQLERVDSYLPPVTEGNVSFEMKTGSYDGRPARTYLVADRRHHDNGTSSVYVRGLVTMDGSDADLDVNSISNQVLAGVEPGLVLANGENFAASSSTTGSDQAFAAGFEEMQSSLSQILTEMEQIEGNASADQIEKFRTQLREILKRGEMVGTVLSR